MRFFKLAIIILSFLIYILVGILAQAVLLVTRFSRRRKVMNYLTQGLIRWFKFIVGIRVECKGHQELLSEHGHYFISRHIGYIDGLVLGSLLPATFISKKEIKSWPLIGWVVQVGETIFVDRQNKTKISQCLKEIEGRLKEKLNILIFPEGTSTDGTKVNPFQAAFFAAPINAQADIVPIIIEYSSIDDEMISPDNRDEICWYGTMPFFSHLWNLLKFQRIEAKVTIKEKIQTSRYQNNSLERKKLAQECYALIQESVDQNMHLFEGLETPEMREQTDMSLRTT